ncbi:MAG TPA: hypothetical protein VGS80_16970 [Ktedonobacterales bacterium]|nr:hypothetical protein [Ktedonobacterales bacterium]
MYLRWQYAGPSSSRVPGEERHFFTTACRYRLSLGENRRDASTRQPRQHVLLYLGIVDEARLTLWPERTRVRYRNDLIEAFSRRLGAAVAAGRVTDAQRVQIAQLLNAAFPKPPAPIVVIPEQVRTKALTQSSLRRAML